MTFFNIRRVSWFSLCLTMIIVCLTACSESVKEVQPPEQKIVSDTPFSPALHDWPHSISDISPNPGVYYGRLDNGLRYAILPMTNKTGGLSAQLNINAGWNQEPENIYGVAHLLEHIAFRDKREGQDVSLHHTMQASGAASGADFNGFTSSENTFYVTNFSSQDKNSLPTALSTLRDLTRFKSVTPENVELDKKIVLAELKLRDTIKAQAQLDYFAYTNPAQPRNQVMGIGTPESLSRITLEDIRNFHTEYYIPENAFLVVAGDVNINETRKLIEDKFITWTSTATGQRPNHKPSPEIYDALPPTRSFQNAKALKQVNIFEHSHSTVNSDTLSYRDRFLSEQIVTSLLHKRIKSRIEKEQAVSWVLPFYSQLPEHNIKGARMGAKEYSEAIKVFEEERIRAVNFGFSEDEILLEIEKRQSKFRRAVSKKNTIKARHEARLILHSYVKGHVYNSAEQRLSNFQAISKAQTKDRIDEVTKEIWKDFDPKIWTQSSKPMKESLVKLKQTRDAVLANKIDITPLTESPKPTFEKIEFQSAGAVIQRDRFKRASTVRLLYENGTRLNYKRNDTVKDEILLSITLKPQNTDFLDHYAAIKEKAPSITRADITGMSATEMDSIFVGKPTQFSTKMVEDRLVLSATTNAQSLLKTLDIITAFLESYDPESLDQKERFKRNNSRIRDQVKASPYQYGAYQMDFLYSRRADSFKARKAQILVSALKRDKQINSIIKTGSIEVGAVGDFDPKVLEADFAKTIGAIKARPDIKDRALYEDVTIESVKPNVRTFFHKGSDKQMAVFYCWSESPVLDAEEKMEMMIIRNILGNRFRDHIREELGLSYAPTVLRQGNKIFPNFGYVCFGTQLDPANEWRTHEGVKNILKEFQTTPISQNELDRVLNPIVSKLNVNEDTNAADIKWVAKAASDPDQWREYKVRIKTLRTIKLKTLQKKSEGLFNFDELSVFRFQHKVPRSISMKNTLETESYLGNGEAKLNLGLSLIKSFEAEEREQGVKLLEQAGAGGKTEAYLSLGKHYLGQGDLKSAAVALERTDDPKEGAYLLGNLYYSNFETFPEIPNERIIQLLTLSAQNGSHRGQHVLAERMKDGTMTTRDDVSALKWALVSYYGKHGKLEITDEKGTERFLRGLSDAEIKMAKQQAQQWVNANP